MSTHNPISAKDIDRLLNMVASGAAVRTDWFEVEAGDVFFALPRHHPDTATSRAMWIVWGLFEVWAPFILDFLGFVIAHLPGGSRFSRRFQESRKHKYDGNAFVPYALQRGASLVVGDTRRWANESYLRVSNASEAFRQLAAEHRRRFAIPVIAITGSSGKTTTKELAVAVLRKRFNVHSTPGTANQEQDICHLLLEMPRSSDIAVLEMGTVGWDTIGEKCRIANPTHGVITNIGKAHLLGLKDIDGVVRAKRQLFDHVAAQGGEFFVCTDEAEVSSIVGDYSRVWTYGTGDTAGLCGDVAPSRETLTVHWHVSSRSRPSSPLERHTIATNLFGAYNLPNVLCAIAIGLRFGVDAHEIDDAIASYLPNNHRSQWIARDSTKFVCDCYNANPSSMMAALRAFAVLAMPHKVAILGEMRELGDHSEKEHWVLLDEVNKIGFDATYLVGESFRAARLSENQFWYPNVSALLASVTASDFAGKLVLLKGSHSVELERVLDLFPE